MDCSIKEWPLLTVLPAGTQYFLNYVRELELSIWLSPLSQIFFPTYCRNTLFQIIYRLFHQRLATISCTSNSYTVFFKLFIWTLIVIMAFPFPTDIFSNFLQKYHNSICFISQFDTTNIFTKHSSIIINLKKKNVTSSHKQHGYDIA